MFLSEGVLRFGRLQRGYRSEPVVLFASRWACALAVGVDFRCGGFRQEAEETPPPLKFSLMTSSVCSALASLFTQDAVCVSFVFVFSVPPSSYLSSTPPPPHHPPRLIKIAGALIKRGSPSRPSSSGIRQSTNSISSPSPLWSRLPEKPAAPSIFPIYIIPTLHSYMPIRVEDELIFWLQLHISVIIIQSFLIRWPLVATIITIRMLSSILIAPGSFCRPYYW